MTIAIAVKYPWGPLAKAVDPTNPGKPLTEPGVILIADSQYSRRDGSKIRPGRKIHRLAKRVAVTFASNDVGLSERAIGQVQSDIAAMGATGKDFNVNDVAAAIGTSIRQSLSRLERQVPMSFLLGMVTLDGKPIILRFNNPEFVPIAIPDRDYVGRPSAAAAFFKNLETEGFRGLQLSEHSGWTLPVVSALAQAVSEGHETIDGPVQHVVITGRSVLEGQAWDIAPAGDITKVGERPSDLRGVT